MTAKRIDVHSHLIPGVDDGCPTLEESIRCARMLVAAGYSHCFCTPHIWPTDQRQTRQSLAQWTAQLQDRLAAMDIPLTLLPGGELNLHPAVTHTPPQRIISMALADRYILVDLWAERLPEFFTPAVKWLQDMGLTVILAHPERMRAVQLDPDLARRFADMGVLLQGNLQCFADHPDANPRLIAEQYLLEGRYFLLGSDTHNVEGLRSRLQGLNNAIALAGQQLIDRLTCENPRKLLPEGAG